MAEFKNPPILSAAPEDGDIMVYDLDSDTWVPGTVADAGAITVPQAHPTEPTATAIDVATTAPTNTTPYGYSTSAQALAIITQGNALVTDVAGLITWADALQAKLTTAGILD